MGLRASALRLQWGAVLQRMLLCLAAMTMLAPLRAAVPDAADKPLSASEARRWLERAAKQDNPLARLELSKLERTDDAP